VYTGPALRWLADLVGSWAELGWAGQLGWAGLG